MIRRFHWSAVLFTVWLFAPSAKADVSENCASQAWLPGKIQCHLDAAEAAGDPGLCEGSGVAIVRFNCLSLYAERAGDPAHCERIGTADHHAVAMRDACVSGVARARREPGVCEFVKSETIRDACYLMIVAEHGGDTRLCRLIGSEALRKSCATLN